MGTGTIGVDDDDVIAIESIGSAELERWPFAGSGTLSVGAEAFPCKKGNVPLNWPAALLRWDWVACSEAVET